MRKQDEMNEFIEGEFDTAAEMTDAIADAFTETASAEAKPESTLNDEPKKHIYNPSAPTDEKDETVNTKKIYETKEFRKTAGIAAAAAVAGLLIGLSRGKKKATRSGKKSFFS